MNRKIGYLALFVALTATSPAWAADRHRAPGPPAPIGKYPVIYQITGLRDDGSPANSGVATTINCTNPTAFPAHLQYLIYNFNSTLVVNETHVLILRQTFTASTHDTFLYDEDIQLGSGVLNEGYAQLRSDNAALLCSAEVVDASPSENFAVTLLARSANSGG